MSGEAHFDGLDVSAPIESVTLLEDRARVLRRTAIERADASRTQLRISDVSPVLVDKTLAVRVASGRAMISDSRVVRRLVPALEDGVEPTTERERLVAECRERRRAETRMNAEAELIDAEADGLHRLVAWSLGDLADDVSRGRGLDEASEGKLKGLRERERELRLAGAVAWHELTLHGQATDRLEQRIAALETPGTTRNCSLLLDLELEAPGPVTLEIEYVVASAMWRPSHIATLSEDADGAVTANIETVASVWQNTGEEWRDAKLYFSTERASLGAEPPQLTTDLLRVKKREDQLVVETREQEVQELSGREGEVSVATDLPGIDDGGQIVLLESRMPVTVPSDGHAHRIGLSNFEASADIVLWAHPELSSSVVYKTVLSNRGAAPILAGPVELIREGGWVGRTSVGFVAPGEEFELSWGPEPTLRARRESIDAREESRALSSWISRKRTVVVRLSNFGREAKTLSVRERVPISEIEKVKIEVPAREATDGATPDDDGFVTWNLTLAPRSQKRLELVYTIKRHSDVAGIF